MRQKFKKFGIAVLTGLVMLTSLAGSLLAPAPARAQWAVTTLQDIPRLSEEIITKIKEGFWTSLGLGAMRSLSYFSRKVAYDTAVWAASGGKGQSPTVFSEGFGNYLKNTASDAFGEALAQLEGDFGLKLCKIPDVKVDLAFRIGIRTQYNQAPLPTGKCNFQSFVKNWSGDAWKSKYGSKDALLKQFNASLDLTQTDFGIYMDSVSRIDNLVAKRQEGNLLDRQEGQGIKSITDKISGNILTPGTLVKKELESLTPSEEGKQSQAQINAVIGSGFFQILPATLATFLDTLASQMLKNFTEKGMFPFGICIGGHGGPQCGNKAALGVTNPNAQGGVGGLAAAQALFGGLLKPVVKSGSYDSTQILGDLNNCPDSPSLYNCRADSGLIAAIQAADHESVTIREAMNDKDWLHKNWRLLGPDRIENDIGKHCFDSQQAYCYTNVKVLRQLRVLPLGFELAAMKSDPDNPWTLEQVVNGYDDCDYNYDAAGNITGVNYDPAGHPFCHLIDPNWVIKLPPTRCDASVFGAQALSADAPYRVEECVDTKSCVAYDASGNCAAYGYCVREANSWNFGSAQTCSPYYATCKNFTDSDNGTSFSYLARTLDTNNCSLATVGCSAYSLTQDSGGNWVAPRFDSTAVNYNTGIHFNNKISDSVCNADSAGCSAFRTSTDSMENLYYRIAPDYLGCYDSNATALGVQWPTNFADLARVTPRSECSGYAGVCIADEVGCNEYTDAVSGNQLPAKFTPFEQVSPTEIAWNDQCDARCVGYDSYREMPTDYSNGNNLTYVVPSAAQSCSAADNGCTGFTNMSATLNGGEQVEYFTQLRSCIKPDPAKQKNFVTYEGSGDGSGYQLKTYLLEVDSNGTSDPGGVAGGPKYFNKTSADLAFAKETCNQTNYQAHNVSADCRQFNDENGNVYYRLLAQTVAVSDACTPYRLNSTEFASATGGGDTGNDPICFQNGRYDKGFCYYDGLPAGTVLSGGDIKSNTCSAAQETCRAYKGNTGNNIKPLVNRDFEEPDLTSALSRFSTVGGGDLRLSSVSVRPNEHSLSYSNTAGGSSGVSLELVNSNPDAVVKDFESGAGYAISFWAKGTDGNNLSVVMSAGVDNLAGTFSVGDSWQLYNFSVPQLLTGGESYSLKIFGNGAKTFYLDNLQISKNSDIYLVKKSITIPGVCDGTSDDNLPGEALGCRAYNVANSSQPIYLHNFSYLCRAGAVGCTGLIKTNNTLDSAMDSSGKTVDEKAPRAYQVRLYRSGIAGSALDLNSGQTLTRVIGADSYSCVVPVGETGCKVNIFGHEKSEINPGSTAFPGGGFVYSELTDSSNYIPADSTDAQKIYLVANADASCSQADLGCVFAGLQRGTPSGPKYDAVLIKNDPAGYSDTLCGAESVGCRSYNSGSAQYYFKDPVALGQKVCQYDHKTVGGVESEGWFWQNVGQCYNGTTAVANSFCQADGDCTGTQTCENVGSTPCYPDYLTTGNVFGLWSYGDTAHYDNFVGACVGEQSGCSEYVDHNDGDKASYLIDNTVSGGNCNGQVSQKEGCVLFDKTDNPGKFYDTAATYLLSQNNDANKVPPVNNPATNDANTVLQVSRDRSCGEWLTCQSSHPSGDGSTQICDSVGLCNQASVSGERSSLTNCVNYVDPSVNHDYGKILNTGLYQTRGVQWSDMDYSGYSIPGMYSANELTQFNIGTTVAPDWRLVKLTKCLGPNSVCKTTAGFECKDNTNGQTCGNGTAVCQNGYCIQTHRGDKNFSPTTVAAAGLPTKLIPSCRAYPEKDSPFLSMSAVNSVLPLANQCAEATNASGPRAAACECDYTKVEYGDNNLNRYFSYTIPNSTGAIKGSEAGIIPFGICQGGDKRDQACSADSDCPGGACQFKTRETKILGWHGYCLEPDYSRRAFAANNPFSCVSWLPVTTLAGFADADSQHIEAGYLPSQQLESMNYSPKTGDTLGQYYCLSSWDPSGFHNEIIGQIGVKAGETGDTPPDTDTTAQFPGYAVYGEVGGYHVFSYSLGPNDDVKKLIKFSAEIVVAAAGGTAVGALFLFSSFLGGIPALVAGLGWIVHLAAGDNGQSARTFFPYQQPPAIYQYDIDYVKFKVVSGSENTEDQDTSVYVYPNVYNGDKPYIVYTIPNSAGDAHYPDKGEPYYRDSNNHGIYVVGNFMGKKNLPAFFYSSQLNDNDGPAKGYINEKGEINYKGFANKDTSGHASSDSGADDALYESVISGNLFGQLSIKKTSYIYDATADNNLKPAQSNILEPVPEDSMAFLSAGPGDPYHPGGVTYDNVCPSGKDDPDKAGKDNWHGAVMQFDTSTKKLLGIWMYYCDQSDDTGEIKYDVVIKRRNQCTSIADTRFDYSGQSSPWTDRLWKGNYSLRLPLVARGVSLGNVAIPFTKPYSPYGSLNISSLVDPYHNLGGLSSGLFGKLPLYVDQTKILPDDLSVRCFPDREKSIDNCQVTMADGLWAPTAPPVMTGYVYGTNDNLANLFARINGKYTFSGNSANDNDYYGGYLRANSGFNQTETLTGQVQAPKVWAVGDCREGVCLQEGSGITINDQSTGDVTIRTSPGKAVMKFYASADPEQMPLREIWVDWGDGKNKYQSGDPSFFRNRLGRDTASTCVAGHCQNSKGVKFDNTCSSNSDCEFLPLCVPEGETPLDPKGPSSFSQILGRTCDDNYYRFDTVYECTRTSAYWKNDTACPSNLLRLTYGGCCAFTPKVQVKDNWGWCNGTCPGGVGSYGCYDDNARNHANDECADPTGGAWTSYSGLVLVPPSEGRAVPSLPSGRAP